MLFSLSFALFLFSSAPTFSEGYTVVGDPYFTSSAGAQTIVSLHNILYRTEELFLPPRLWAEERPVQKISGVMYRLAKTLLIDDVYDHFLFLAQHEVFGHGARYRELGYTDNLYHIGLVFPYGDSSGFARLGQSTRAVTNTEHIARVVGGNEANTILSHELRQVWLDRRAIHYRESLLYAAASANLGLYILGTYSGILGDSGNDILQYLGRINNTDIQIPELPPSLTIERLAIYSLITLADPFLWFAASTYAVPYLILGRSEMPLPMIHIGNVSYLPAFHLSLTPFGPEVVLLNYIASSRRSICVHLRAGDPTLGTFFGGGVDIENVVERIRIAPSVALDTDASLHFWYQPIMDAAEDYPTLLSAELADSRIGGLISITSRLWFLDNVGVTARVGYKAEGFMQGEPLREGFVVQGGLLLQL